MNKNTMGADAAMEARRRKWLGDVKERAAQTLKTALTPLAGDGSMSQAVSALHSMTMENIALIERNAEMRRNQGQSVPQVACKKGCDFCCFLRVRASIPEVLNIADHVQRTWSPDKQADLLARVEANLSAFEGLNAKDRLAKMLPCPLLVDHTCSIHSIRPIACRSHHSIDVEACKRGLVDPETVQIPHFLEVETVISPIVEGIDSAVKGSRLKDDGVTLVSALHIALTEPDAKQRWLKGYDVFAPAVDEALNRLASSEARGKEPRN